MPQMSPMSWVIMMILFISMYVIFNTTQFLHPIVYTTKIGNQKKYNQNHENHN